MSQQTYSLGDIVSFLNSSGLTIELRGDASAIISGLATLEAAGSGDLAFLSNPKYENQLATCNAEAVILHPNQADQFAHNCLISDNPYLCFAKISRWFDPLNVFFADPEVHSTAVIDSSADIASDASIGPNVVIEADVRIGQGCQIGANSTIGRGSVLGDKCVIKSNVSLYHNVRIGHNVVIHSGAVLGADGFGFAPNGSKGWQKIHQVGGVVVGNDVEIGACSTVDRGAIEDTRVGDGVIIDNHVQIAHNAIVGDNTAMAAYSAVAGSAKVGKNCILAGGARVVGHVSLCDNVQLTAHTLITKDIDQPGSYSSAATPLMSTSLWRKNAVRLAQLNDLSMRVRDLEKKTN
jgi:UDP-3-O-[3-hydroxymyristoyl] glucosamine N-acyltransferase